MRKDKTLIIAEAGVNHNGSLDIAKKLIDVAYEAGADFVKFQTFNADDLLTKETPKAEYQKKDLADNESQYEMIKKLELSEEDHIALISYCDRIGIKFLSTAFDISSIDLLIKLDIPLFKIPSGEITNLPYLRRIGKTGKPIVMSTGMANLSEVDDALSVLLDAGARKEEIIILHCSSDYPTPVKDVNLNAMITLREKFGVRSGYSDHTEGIEVSIAAATLGASLVEKHFTLDNKMEGPDHKASLDPVELKKMIYCIRNIETALGGGMKAPNERELRNVNIVRKSIVAKNFIKKGDTFSEKNITTKRPGDGISPMKWDDIIGTKSTKDYCIDDLI